MRKTVIIGVLAVGTAMAAATAVPMINHARTADPGRWAAAVGDGAGDTEYDLVSNGSKGTPGVGLEVIGLTKDQRLVAFRTKSPDKVRTLGKVNGLQGDTSLVGIDFRVQDGKLYGVGDGGGIYTLDVRTAAVTRVSQLTATLSGQSFGVDFNPAANRLRVISDTGQNLRHNIDDPNGAPAAGMTAVDGMLTIPPAATAATGVTGAAYTNNDLDTNTATTLFDLDTNLNQIEVQSPANAGSLAPTGKLLVDPDGDAGLDVYSTVQNGVSVAATGYATLKVGGRYHLYRIELLTGKATDRGVFGARLDVVDIALPLNQH